MASIITKHFGESEMGQQMGNMIKGVILSSELIIKAHHNGVQVWVSIKGSDEAKDATGEWYFEMLQPLHVLLQKGLSHVSEKGKESSIEFNVASNNTFSQQWEFMKEGKGNLWCALCRSLKLECKVFLQTEFAANLKATVQQIDESFVHSPIMLFLSYFKMLDVDYRLDTVDSLPDSLKKTLMVDPF